MGMTRREALTTLAAGGSAVLITSRGMAMPDQEPRTAATSGLQVATGKHALAPLPFDPKKLKGLSERLLVSHHENNYGGALKNLNKGRRSWRGVTRDTCSYPAATEGARAHVHEPVILTSSTGNLEATEAGGRDSEGAGRHLAIWCWEDFRATGMSSPVAAADCPRLQLPHRRPANVLAGNLRSPYSANRW